MRRRTFFSLLAAPFAAMLVGIRPAWSTWLCRKVPFNYGACWCAMRVGPPENAVRQLVQQVQVRSVLRLQTGWGQTRVMIAGACASVSDLDVALQSRRESPLLYERVLNAQQSLADDVAEACERGWWDNPVYDDEENYSHMEQIPFHGIAYL